MHAAALLTPYKADGAFNGRPVLYCIIRMQKCDVHVKRMQHHNDHSMVQCHALQIKGKANANANTNANTNAKGQLA